MPLHHSAPRLRRSAPGRASLSIHRSHSRGRHCTPRCPRMVHTSRHSLRRSRRRSGHRRHTLGTRSSQAVPCRSRRRRHSRGATQAPSTRSPQRTARAHFRRRGDARAHRRRPCTVRPRPRPLRPLRRWCRGRRRVARRWCPDPREAHLSRCRRTQRQRSP